MELEETSSSAISYADEELPAGNESSFDESLEADGNAGTDSKLPLGDGVGDSNVGITIYAATDSLEPSANVASHSTIPIENDSLDSANPYTNDSSDLAVELASGGVCESLLVGADLSSCRLDTNRADFDPESTDRAESHTSASGRSDGVGVVKIKPGTYCTDASQAVEILRTGHHLSDVSFRKSANTWSCYNIADVIRGPLTDGTWWKRGSFQRKSSAEKGEYQDLCRTIEKKDQELILILDDILRVARKNAYHEVPGWDPEGDEDLEADSTQGSHDGPRAASADADQSRGAKSKKPRNALNRMMGAILRRLSRRGGTMQRQTDRQADRQT